MASNAPSLDDDPGTGSSPGTGPTVRLPSDAPHAPAELAWVAAGKGAQAAAAAHLPSQSLTSAGDALRNEEIERTRLFIVMGWVISVAAIGTVPFVDAPRFTAALFIGGLLVGIAVSIVLHRRFANPRNYTERALIGLALMCLANGHIAVL